MRFEVRSDGHLEPGLVRVPVSIPLQPPHVPSQHYLWSTCRLNPDQKGATIVYSVHDREQTEAGSEAPLVPALMPVMAEPVPAPQPVDLSPLERQLRELMEAVADLASSNLRQRQELDEAHRLIGTLARVVMSAQVYATDGKPATIGVPKEQVQALRRAMERAA